MPRLTSSVQTREGELSNHCLHVSTAVNNMMVRSIIVSERVENGEPESRCAPHSAKLPPMSHLLETGAEGIQHESRTS